MYGLMCATRADDLEQLKAMGDAAFTAHVFGPLMDDHERTLHLEKLWAAVDFVLTGATLDEPARPPLDFLRSGAAGEPIGPDLGHGRARYLSPHDLRAIALAIDAAHEAIDARTASPRLAGVHPFDEPAPDDAELLAAAMRTIATMDEPDATTTPEALVAKLKPPRGPRPSEAERADIREAITELRAFLAKLAVDGSGALISVA